MGAVLSLFLTVVGLLAVGVISSLAASKSGECADGKKWSIISAVIAFIVAIIAFLIAVFLL